MTEPRTAIGKRLADWGVEDIALVEAEAAAMERKRLRAEHRTWDGHPSRGYSCGICDELLAPVKAAKETSVSRPRNVKTHTCICPERPRCDVHGWVEHGGGEPDVCQVHGHSEDVALADIKARDREVDTSPLWRGWQTQHPTVAQLIRDRRELLRLIQAAKEAER